MKMRHVKSLGILCLVGILLTGCGDEEGISIDTETGVEKETTEQATTEQATALALEQLVLGDLSNLDLSEVPDEIALPEHMYVMESQAGGSTWTDEKIYVDFPQAVAAYGGPSVEELDPDNNFFYELWVEGNREPSPIGSSEGDRIIYYSEPLFVEMTTIRQCMTEQPDVIARITGDEWDHWWIWIPNEHGTSIATYYTREGDLASISYQLDGEEVTLAEGVEFVEKTLTENEKLPYISTPGIEYRVDYVDVYQYGENYGYYFTVNLYYEGEILCPISGALRYNNADKNKVHYTDNLCRCFMLQKNEINGIYPFGILNETPDSIEEAELNVDYDMALKILSGYLSQNHLFKLLSAELMYSSYVEYEDDLRDGVYHVAPTWSFEMSTEGVREYRDNRLFAVIDIQTGEVVELWR